MCRYGRGCECSHRHGCNMSVGVVMSNGACSSNCWLLDLGCLSVVIYFSEVATIVYESGGAHRCAA